jgi:glyoxylase-like metal-dependent hydrolase (beta-lactamase superfamily II)
MPQHAEEENAMTAPVTSSPADQPLESIAELVRFAPDSYGFRYQNHVSLFIVTGDGVILIDPCGQGNPRTPSMIKEAARSVTDQDVKYVVYSHWGADHGMGGAVFADTAQFVGHRNVVGKIAEANDPGSPVPEITFDDHLDLNLGGTHLDLYWAGLSAKDDYIIVHHPASRLIMTVDYVQPKNAPFRTLLGHPDRTAERQKWIADHLDFAVLISGHASPHMTGTRADVLEARQYLLDLSDAMASARSAGHADGSPAMVAAVKASLAPKYGSWRRFDDFLPLNIEGVSRWRAEEP